MDIPILLDLSRDTNLVKEHWSTVDCSASDKNFYSFPPIRSRSCNLIFNETNATRRDWCEYWTIEKILKNKIPCDTILSICCGFGQVERTLSKLKCGKKIVGIDIAPGAVDAARKMASEEGCQNIEYYVADIQKETLPDNTFDIIWANGALHHIKDIDYCVPMLHKALKPDGVLISNEYVGPNYQQISKRHEELVNAAIHILPPELREDPYEKYKNAKSVKIKGYYLYKNLLSRIRKTIRSDENYRKPSIYYFLTQDPSECVNSEIIIPTLKKHFATVDVKYYNGSILLFALGPTFFNNFDGSKPAHHLLLDLLFEFEETLVEIGEIPNINAHIICQKR